MNMYTLGIKSLDELIKGFPPGSNIMLLGPPMSGKAIFLRNLFYNRISQGDAGVYISTKETGDNLIDWFNMNEKPLDSKKYGIIDCVSKTLQMDINIKDDEYKKYVSSPVDLTGISVKVNDLLEKFWRGEGIRSITIGVESLSALLMYSNLQTVFRFLHVFTSRVRSVGAFGVYTVEEGMHDQQTVATLKQLFQGLIEIKVEDDVNKIRVMPPGAKPTEWLKYELSGGDFVILEG